MLKLYDVKVWRTGEPHNFEYVEVRTYTARRAQLLALETYPGCKAHTQGVFLRGTWRSPTQDD